MMKTLVLLKLMPLFWQGHAQDEDFLIQMVKENDVVLRSAATYVELHAGACSGQYLSTESGQQTDLSACEAACSASTSCKFLAFCPSGTTGCTGGNENKCAMYGTFTSATSHEGYTTYSKQAPWLQVGSDIDGEAQFDRSGESVSISGDGSTVAIGAQNNDGNEGSGPIWSTAGHVRVYRFGSSDWVQLGSDIDGEAESDYSGHSVSISGDGSTVAIGSTSNSGSAEEAGHVRVYRFGSSDWVQLGSDIDGEAQFDNSGESVSISGDGSTVAIGSKYNSGSAEQAGHVRVYRFGSSDWVQLGSDIDGEAEGDGSGWSVSISGDGSTVAIGAKHNDGSGPGTDTFDAGHVRVYRLQQAPPAGAYGDPHCVNAKGDWFDIHAVGRIPMVILPLGTSVEKSDFAVIATTTTPVGWDKCAPTFITAVDAWANQADDQLRVDAGPAGDLQVKPMKGSTEAYSITMLSEKVMIKFRSMIVSVILNKVPKIDKAPFVYFDMEVAGLQALKAGGILGADPHDSAEVQPDGCSEVTVKHNAVDRYSMARAMP